MDPTAVIIAVAGLAATASSPLLLSWRNARNQRQASLRDLQTVLYTEAAVYAQALESRIERMTEPYSTSKKGPELTHTDALTARMRLLAPNEVTAAWKQLVDDAEIMKWNIEEEFPGLGHDPREAVPDNHPDVVRVRSSIERFYAVTTRAAQGRK